MRLLQTALYFEISPVLFFFLSCFFFNFFFYFCPATEQDLVIVIWNRDKLVGMIFQPHLSALASCNASLLTTPSTRSAFLHEYDYPLRIDNLFSPEIMYCHQKGAARVQKFYTIETKDLKGLLNEGFDDAGTPKKVINLDP